MSAHFNVFFGAYLLVPLVLRTPSWTAYECSGHCGRASAPPGARFCPACGSAVVPAPRPATLGPLRISQVRQGAFEDEFFTPESGRGKTHSVWLPNATKEFGMFITDRTSSAPEDLAHLQVASADPERHRLALLAAHEPLLTAIQEEYKVEPVVQVGLVPYWA